MSINRLQKRCFVVSASAHLLLASILLFGVAFAPSQIKPREGLPLLDLSNLDPPGANPGSQSPIQAQSHVSGSGKSGNVSPGPTAEPFRKRVEIRLKEVTRTVQKTSSGADASTQRDNITAANTHREILGEINRALERLTNSLAGSTDVEPKNFGQPSGSDAANADFLQQVRRKYADAWVVPDGVSDKNSTTSVAVTIARDGTVVSTSITRFSGDAATDASVRNVLDQIKVAAPLPADSRENIRTVTIRFNVRLKLGF